VRLAEIVERSLVLPLFIAVVRYGELPVKQPE